MARGSVFKKFAPIIRFLVFCNSIFSIGINKFFLRIFRNTTGSVGILIRYIILKNVCTKIGDNVVIFESVVFDAPEQMCFGDNVAVYPFCYLAGEITIGNDVAIAHTTAIHSVNHKWDNLELPIQYNATETKRVIIEDDVWIACNCVILSGVTIGSRSVIAAGAIVNKSVQPHSLVGGNPAKLIRTI